MTDQLSWESIGERVRESRSAAGLSQHALGELIGLERSMVSKLESGERRIDAVELTHLARALDCPLSHFLSPAPEVVSRRSAIAGGSAVGDSQAARSAYRTEALLSVWLRDVRQLIDLGFLAPRPMARFPKSVSDTRTARRAALWLRSELGLSTEPIESVAAVCEQAGQFTAVVSLPSDGASLVDDDVAVAVVAEEQAPGRRRSTAAHELGHMVLGDEYSNDLGVHASREDRERVIEAFAAELLLPNSALREVLVASEGESRRHALVTLAARYRVSWSLAVSQLRQHGSLDSGELHRLRVCVPTDVEFREALGWKPQPDLASVRVPPGISSAVVAAVREHAITPRRGVEMLRGQITLQDLSED